MTVEVTIIGGGPAGISTAIQLKRFNIGSVLFEKNELGGLVRSAHQIENYPGFPGGITGTDLVERLKKQVFLSDIEVLFEKVEKLTFLEDQNRFLVETNSGLYHSRIVVVASGTEPKTNSLLNSIPQDLSQNVLFDIHSILGARKKKILILGAGDIAFDYALNLSRCNEVIILNRSSSIRALPVLTDRVKNNPDIHYIEYSQIKNIKKGNIKKLLVTFKNGDHLNKNEVDYLVVATGRIPQKDFYTPGLFQKEKKLISQGLLYLAGDVKNGLFRQIAISAGNGIKTAMKIDHRMEEIGNESCCKNRKI